MMDDFDGSSGHERRDGVRINVNVTAHLHLHSDSNDNSVLLEILDTVRAINFKENVQMARLDNLEAAVTANGDVTASAKLLIEGIAAALAEAKTDPVKLADLATKLTQQKDALAAAVAANTPAA